MKKIGVLVLSFVMIVFLLVNCEKENIYDSEETQIIETSLKINNVKLSDIPDIKNYLSSKVDENMFKSTEINGAIFEDDILKVIDTLNKTNYSFKFIYLDTPIGTFYNLVVGKSEEGELITPYVLKYICDDASLEQFIENDFDFDFFVGTVNLHKYTDFFEVGSIYKSNPPTNCPRDTDANGDPVPCEQTDASGGGSSSGSGNSNDGSSTGGGSTGGGSTGGETACSFSVRRVFYRCDSFYGPENNNYDICSRSVATWTCPSNKSSFTKNGDDCPDCPPLPTGTIGVGTSSKTVQKTNFYLDDSLTNEELSFLNSNVDVAQEINTFLLSDRNSDGTFPEESQNAAKMAITAERTNRLTGPYNTDYYNSIDQYTQADLTDPATIAKWAVHFSMQCAILKIDNPTWSNTRIYWVASREMIHIGLDIVGMVPAVGIVCDLVNGSIYAIEGDGVNATLSFAAAIPIAGWWATGAKYAKKAIVLTNGSKTTLKWVVKANNVIAFGNRGQLRKILGLAVGDARQAHHIIPWNKQVADVIQKAAKDSRAFHMNEALNGIAIAAWRNQPNHNLYDGKIQALFNKLPANLTDKQAYDAVNNIISRVRSAIKNNPTVHLNDLVF